MDVADLGAIYATNSYEQLRPISIEGFLGV